MAYRPTPDKAVTIMDLYNEKLGKLSKTIQPNGGVEKPVIEPITIQSNGGVEKPVIEPIKEVPKESIKAVPKEPIKPLPTKEVTFHPDTQKPRPPAPKEVPKEPIKAISKVKNRSCYRNLLCDGKEVPKEPIKAVSKAIKEVPKEPVKPLIDPHHQKLISERLRMQKSMQALSRQRARLMENLQSLSRSETQLRTHMDEWIHRAQASGRPKKQILLAQQGMNSNLGDINRERGRVQSRLDNIHRRVGQLKHHMSSMSSNQMSPSGFNKIKK